MYFMTLNIFLNNTLNLYKSILIPEVNKIYPNEANKLLGY